MNRPDRIFDLIDPVIKRPGMYVGNPMIIGVFNTIYNFDYALFMAESYDKRDKGEEVEFMQSSKTMANLIDYLRVKLKLKSGKYELGNELLEIARGDDEAAMMMLRDAYVQFRGEDYCRYMPGGKLASGDA